jgi:hypothetical protein
LSTAALVNIAALRRKAGCGDTCRVWLRDQGLFLVVAHRCGEKTLEKFFDPTGEEWANKVISWLAKVPHE